MLAFLILLVGCSGKYDTFAQCLTEEDVIFYGAFWCPHCAAQKELFGSSMKHITYIECSTPDRSGQTQSCKDKDIQSYPTWIIADEERLPGVQALEKLSVKTGCSLE